MGRWGYRLFGGDTDCDLESDILDKIGKKLAAEGVIESEHLRDLLENAKQDTFQPRGCPINSNTFRVHLDDGICTELIRSYRETNDMNSEYALYGLYPAVIAGAIMMRAGAKISSEDRLHLRVVAEGCESYAGYRLPIGDLGFRNPGQNQFFAALQYYIDGQPRSFSEPSCFHCGKVGSDLGANLLKCSRCERAWYCDKECQRGNWKEHKAICPKPGPTPGGFMMLNV